MQGKAARTAATKACSALLAELLHRFTPRPPLPQSELLGEERAASMALPTAVLTTLRLARDELGFRPLAVAGDLQVRAAAGGGRPRMPRRRARGLGALATCTECPASPPSCCLAPPVPSACPPQTARVEQVLAAPKVSSEGVFGNFKVPADGVQHEWVVSALLLLLGGVRLLPLPGRGARCCQRAPLHDCL